MAAPAWLTARPIAHRGYHDAAAGRIENTLPAAEAAIAKNFAVECDLQLTADGAAVVFHDDTLDRLMRATGAVDRKTLGEIRAARFRDSDATVPTLDELLDLVDGRVPLVIEFKSKRTGDRRLETAVAPMLAGYDGPVAVMSFDPASVAALRRLVPDLPRGLTADRYAAEDWPELTPAVRFRSRYLLDAPMAMPHFIAYDVKALPASIPLALRHFFGLPLLTWTVRTAEDRATAREWADQIIFEGFDPDAPA
jgi:glycerophosphoryl diester phosphodiesterase